MKEIERYIEEQIIPRYTSFDRAHSIDHVRTVIDESLALAEHYDVDRRIVYVIAAYHDLGLCEGRERHHIVSGEIVRADKQLRNWFTDDEIEMVACAVEDHRASSDHEPRSIYGRIVAEADRVIDPEITLRRTVQYGLANYPQLDTEGQYARFCAHLQEKYAEGGYLRLWIPESKNGARLAELRQLIRNSELLRHTFERLLADELKR
ncbi:MAG: HD domain-containing protein [Rikenellaceae bacterium]|nr:HD domain-containing protein [Rikenellaceae bacterium]MBR2419532.1 HD domain-containing protein [Rikenellaceae bacterium]MBR3800116.1 HD domain-containing protein [Rikenellaceae bacterium]